MKNLFKMFLLVGVIATSSAIFAERACNARDNSCSWGHKNREIDHSKDGIASAAIRPVDFVPGVREVTKPVIVPVDAVLPPWPYANHN